jgi:hypothetical protein
MLRSRQRYTPQIMVTNFSVNAPGLASASATVDVVPSACDTSANTTRRALQEQLVVRRVGKTPAVCRSGHQELEKPRSTSPKWRGDPLAHRSFGDWRVSPASAVADRHHDPVACGVPCRRHLRLTRRRPISERRSRGRV